MFFALKIEMTASAIDTLTNANSRALSTSLAWAVTSDSATRFHIVTTVSNCPFQNLAVSTSAGVAVAALPMLFVSLKSAV